MREEGIVCDFRVGDEWLVQPRLNRVSGKGRVVQLQPKIMGVLCALAERPGEVVTRGRLFETVWKDTHVTEHVLARSISELRRVFGDTPKSPSFIETIPKVGYRFIAPVSKILDVHAEAPSLTHRETPEIPGHSPRKSSRFWLGVGALSLAAGFMLLAVYLLFFVHHIGHFHFRHP